MMRWLSSHAPPPLPPWRRAGFVGVTLLAYILDARTVTPRPVHRDGTRFTAWGSWETSVLQFSLLLAVVYVALLLRRRWPLASMVGISGLSLAFTLAQTPSLPVAGVLVTLYTVAALARREWQAYLALGVALTTQVVGTGLLLGQDPDILVALLVVGGLSVAMWIFGRRDHRAMRAAADLPEQLAEHGAQAVEDERRRIARELHDIVAHSVSAMVLQAAGAKAVTAALRHDVPDEPRLETVSHALATIEGTGSQSMRELHRLLGALRDDADATAGAGGEPSSQPGMDEIDDLLELARQSGLVVEVHAAGHPVRLDPSVGLAAYRVVQESLTNAMKHGGRGAVVDLFENWRSDSLQLQVRCRGGHDGVTPGSTVGGRGLHGLRERVELIGGAFESGWVNEEFVATAVLPLTSPVRPGEDEPATAAGPAAGAAAVAPAGPEAVQGRRGPGLAGRYGQRVAAVWLDRRLIP